MYFDRFDICEAYYIAEVLWNVSGILQERKSNQRRNMSADYQLHRMGFSPRPMLSGPEDLTENGQEIYANLMDRYGFEEHQES